MRCMAFEENVVKKKIKRSGIEFHDDDDDDDHVDGKSCVQAR